MPKSIKLAQIGYGAWGPNLTKNFCQLAACNLDMIIESDLKRHEAIRELYPKIQCETDVEHIFNSNVDAAIVSTPAASHYQLTKELLLNGIHVFVEKPLATDYHQALELSALARSRNLILMVGHVYLYHDAFKYFYSQFSTIGDPYYLISYRNNFGNLREDVNAWWNLAPHDISMLLFLMNSDLPSTISATGGCFLQEGIEDYVTAELEWKSGLKAQVNVNWLYPQKMRKLIAVGSDKMLIFDDTAEKKIEVHHKKIDLNCPANKRHISTGVSYPDISIREPLLTEAQYFIDCIQNKASCIKNLQEACKVIKILELGNLSLKTGGIKIEITADELQYSIS